MSRRTFFYVLTVALSGFLFGFDTAAISGAEQAIQRYWSLNSLAHGLTVSISLMGTVPGALFGGVPADRFGRKYTLIGAGVLFLLSIIGAAMSSQWYIFLSFRFLIGFSLGSASVSAPMYISEISPAKDRGRLVAVFQFNIVLGILIAFISNYFIDLAGNEQSSVWRWMLAVEIIPALVFLVGMRSVPESPRWLIVRKNDVAAARRVLLLNDEVQIEKKIESIYQSAEGKRNQISLANYKKPILLAVTIAFFNQMSGINAIIYYAPRIFEFSGLERGSALLSSVGIGFVNFIFTLLAMFFIDKVGRRVLMHIGSFGLVFTLGAISLSYMTSIGTSAIPFFILLFIAFFAFSQGTVIWVFISEIFPNHIRAFGQSLGSFVLWLTAAIVAFTFPSVTENIGPGKTFLIFTSLMVMQWIFVWKWMPETRGKSLEELGHNMTSS